jgi:putative ABC transport system ATP-binding protein
MTAATFNFRGTLTEPVKVRANASDVSLDCVKAEGKAIVARAVEMEFQTGSQRTKVLSNIDLDVRCGEIQLLMGPSGSGKTTLLSILGGILTPTSGSVRLLGHELTQMSRSQLAQYRLHHIGFIFQEFNLFPALTALENIKLTLNLKNIKGRAAQAEAMHLLEQVGLADRANYRPGDLSGGQKQRVAIARALAGNPEIIMADEPTAALDSQSGHAVISLLRQLVKESNRTVVMVTHDSRIVDVADQVTYLEDGRLQSA